MMELLSSPQMFWIPLLQIIGVNIVLSGDNAVVIALAARALPPAQQKKAIIWGSGAAIIMRIVLTLTAVALLSMPYLKLVGSVLLFWIGIQLINSDDEGENIESSSNLAAAIKTILIADLVMSLDNVIAVAAAAKGSFVLLIIGLAISIPLVIFGATMLLRLMERFPIIITLGGMLLGWIAGGMLVTDPVFANPDKWQWMLKMPVDSVTGEVTDVVKYGASVAGALLVLLAGKIILARRASAGSAPAGH